MSSFRLFRVAICGLDNMKNFSVIHRLQRLEYDLSTVLDTTVNYLDLFIYIYMLCKKRYRKKAVFLH